MRREGIFNPPLQKTRRQELRNNPTAAETELWRHLKGRQLLGRKFRRQCGIGHYVVDFYCPECRLIIELDGAPHFAIGVDDYEEDRFMYFQRLGLREVRFENKTVFRNLEAVLETIRQEIYNSPPPPRRDEGSEPIV
jgi:very-short-patch-repair endonuclease